MYKQVKVRAVRVAGIQDVYDITMPKNGNFIINSSIISSNCPHSAAYANIAAVTIFMKTRFRGQFWAVLPAMSNQKEVSRLLAVVEKDTRPPCALRSELHYWSCSDGLFFPHLLSIDGLREDVARRILEVRKDLTKEQVLTMSPRTWFERFGKITPSVAKSIAAAGLLRIFGAPSQVAHAYLEANSANIAKNKKKSTQKKLGAKDRQALIDSASKALTQTTQDDEYEVLISALGGETSSSKIQKPQLESLDAPDDVSEVPDTLSPDMFPKAIREVYEVLLSESFDISGANQSFENMDSVDEKGIDKAVFSALTLVSTSKVKGFGLKYLVSALEKREVFRANQEKREDYDIYTNLSVLKAGKLENGEALPTGFSYLTVGIPKSISMNENKRTGQSEARIVFVADGVELGIKTSTTMGSEELEEVIAMCKDATLSYPLALDVYVGEFTPGGESRAIKYYKLNKIKKV